MEKLWWTSSSGLIEIELPINCIKECSSMGSVDDIVEAWSVKLGLDIPRLKVEAVLLEYGCWDMSELIALSYEELIYKLIWVASGDLFDSMDD